MRHLKMFFVTIKEFVIEFFKKEYQCKEKGCTGEIKQKKLSYLPNGELDMEKIVSHTSLPWGALSNMGIGVYPCNKCGRIHTYGGKPINHQTEGRSEILRYLGSMDFEKLPRHTLFKYFYINKIIYLRDYNGKDFSVKTIL